VAEMFVSLLFGAYETTRL